MSNRKTLAELFNDYEDEEFHAYQKQKKLLFSSGISLVFKDFSLDLDNGENSQWCGTHFARRPNFTRFLEEGCVILEKGWFKEHIRKKRSDQVVLFEDETLELSFKTKNAICPMVIRGKLHDLTQRHDPKTAKFLHQNYLKSLPEIFLKQVNNNKEIVINVRIIESGTLRSEVEQKDQLNDIHAYAYSLINIDEIKQKLTNSTMMVADRAERLELWGFKVHHRTPTNDVAKIIDQLPRSDFGIKNVLHLRYIVENINSSELSNLELLSPPEKILEYQERLIRFQKSLDEMPRLVLPKRKNDPTI